MKGRFPSKGTSSGIGNCPECSVRIPAHFEVTICRCCAADAEPDSDKVGADTGESGGLMPFPPAWSVSHHRRFPQLESIRLTLPDGSKCEVALWWMPQGNKWIAQHPLEYPRNRLRNRSLPDQGT